MSFIVQWIGVMLIFGAVRYANYLGTLGLRIEFISWENLATSAVVTLGCVLIILARN